MANLVASAAGTGCSLAMLDHLESRGPAFGGRLWLSVVYVESVSDSCWLQHGP
jgi:hypothetical protein